MLLRWGDDVPFTGSHPAAVLPLMRWGLVPSALVIGSMVPDLPYFVPSPVDAGTTHSLVGTVSVDVVLGGAVFIVWHAALAPFAVAMAPAPVRGRLDPTGSAGSAAAPVTVRGVVLVLLSLAVGAATHTLWDAFTHAGGWGPAHIGWLAEQHAGLPVYRWAQYGSGIVGAAIIAAWLVRWWRRSPAVACSGFGPVAWTVWTVVVLAGVAGGLAAALPALEDEGLLRIVFLAGTGAAGSGLVAAVLCAGFWIALTRRG
jgi:Domain of unknown function (DUF4184)